MKGVSLKHTSTFPRNILCGRLRWSLLLKSGTLTVSHLSSSFQVFKIILTTKCFVVEKNGDVCISILHEPGDDKWGYEKACERWLPIHTVETIMISVISMLADPNDQSPANVDAAKEWREIFPEFKRKVARCVRRSQEEMLWDSVLCIMIFWKFSLLISSIFSSLPWVLIKKLKIWILQNLNDWFNFDLIRLDGFKWILIKTCKKIIHSFEHQRLTFSIRQITLSFDDIWCWNCLLTAKFCSCKCNQQ